MIQSALYSLSIGTLPRRKGRNIVQIAAYVSGQKIANRVTGHTFGRHSTESIIDYRLVGTSLSLEEFFNRSEQAEKRKDANVGRHGCVALPRGMPREEMILLMGRLAGYLKELAGVPVLFAIHQQKPDADKPANPHGHFVFGPRPWHEDTRTFAEKRFRELDAAKTGSVIIEKIRAEWETIINSSLPPGVPPVTRLSNLRQKNGRIPRRHIGYHAAAIEQQTGVRSRAGEFNDLVDEDDVHGRALAALHGEEQALLKQIQAAEELSPITAAASRTLAKARSLITTAEMEEAAVAVLNPRRPASQPKPKPLVAEDEIVELLRPFRRHPARKMALARQVNSGDLGSVFGPR